MIKPTNYARPKTLHEALHLLNRSPNSLTLAGGALTFGAIVLPYDTFIDLQEVSELKGIRYDGDELTLGGGTRLDAVVDSEYLHDDAKLAITRTLPSNLRNNTSVAESLLAKPVLTEWLAVLAALNARVEITTEDGHEMLPIINLTQQFPSGILTALVIPNMPYGAVLATAHVARTPVDSALVNAAALVTLASNGDISYGVVVIGGASAQQIDVCKLTVIEGNPFNETIIAIAAEEVIRAIVPLEDARGSADYRHAMVGVLTQRALNGCLQQIRHD